jgi:hypothetical protein
MLSMPAAQINELCSFAHIADKETRSDLVGGYIVSEDDYTSNFTGSLRRIINSQSSTGLSASSHRLQPHDERLTGCDAIIFITSNGYFKIAIFEAKYPRISQPAYSWDYLQKSTSESHFSGQLDRQTRFASTLAIFEMFYCELPFGTQPRYMHNEGSSCVWHKDAVAFEAGRATPMGIWSSRDLVGLLSAGNYPIENIIRKICDCSQGKAKQYFGELRILDIARELSIFGHILHVAAHRERQGARVVEDLGSGGRIWEGLENAGSTGLGVGA